MTERVRACDLQPGDVIVATDRKTFPIYGTLPDEGKLWIETNERLMQVLPTTWFVRLVNK